MWRSIAVAVALLGAAAAAPAAAEALVSATGVVADGESNGDRIWFQLQRDDKRFVVDPAQLKDANAFWSTLKQSNGSGRGIVVRYDADAGFIDFATSAPTFVVRELVYEGRTLAGAPQTRGAGAEGHGPRRTAEAALARAVALSGHGDLKGSRAAVNRALAADVLEPRLKALAFKTRGDAASSEAYGHLRGDRTASDRLLAAALADYDAWRELTPQDPEAVYSVAQALRELGAYEEALVIYRALLKTEPPHDFWAYVRIGATYRTLGEPDKALAALDDLVKALGPQDGMAYHFHRGWTLTDLGRLDEAEKEFTAGFRTQPDFAWAYLRRACALARLGRLTDALADQERGVKLMGEDQADGVVAPRSAYELKWAAGQADRLKAAVAANPTAKLDLPCDSDWDEGDKRRARSPLLADWARRHAAPAEVEPERPPPPAEPARTDT